MLNRTAPAALQIVQSPEKAAVLLQPGRLELVEQLDQPDSAAGLARRLGVPRQKLNYHLRELEKEGFLELVEERRKGNCMERVVRAAARAFVIAPSLAGTANDAPNGAAMQDRFSAAYLISTAARAIRELTTMLLRARKAGKRVATLTLDAEIRFASTESRAAFAEELAQSIAQLTAKYHREHAEGGRRFRFIVAVHPALTPTPSRPQTEETESLNLE